MTSTSPPWSSGAKLVVSLVALVLIGALILRFHGIIPLLVTAAILAFLMVPIVRLLAERSPLSWAMGAHLVFLLLLILVIAASTATSLAAIQQLQALVLTIQRILFELPQTVELWSAQSYALGPWTFSLAGVDLAPFAEQALRSIQPLLGEVSGVLRSLATVAIESVAQALFVLVVAYFLTLDYHRIRNAWQGFRVPGHEEDIARLRQSLGRIWHSFLRGQLLIVLITGVLTGFLMTFLGVRFSVGLGILGGLAKFVPIVGPFTAGLLAALVALFQPDHLAGLSPLSHSLLIVVAVVVLDQSIDYLLLPRIMGASLNLHPIIILVGAIIGASLAGIIGLLLSAPAMATIILLSRYTYRKMVDLPPWEPPIDGQIKPVEPPLAWLRRWRRTRAVE